MSKTAEATRRDCIKGCLFGGAAGDALGYAVEFMTYDRIRAAFGPDGIRRYELHNGRALISDDTQMTLFTANGILIGNTRGAMRGISGPPHGYVYRAYLDWLDTQGCVSEKEHHRICWLTDVPELHSRRAPGNTCLSALTAGQDRSAAAPINGSKGCGAVMRIAPYGLFYDRLLLQDAKLFLDEAAEIGALTHGHPMSHLSCALIADIIARILREKTDGKPATPMTQTAKAALDDVRRCMRYDDLPAFAVLIEKAIALAEREGDDADCIAALGQGWIAEEAAAVAIFCACKYQNDPVRGITAAVNHSGDSDSTGAIAGNLLGVQNGYAALPRAWTEPLEIRDVIAQISEDLTTGCPCDEYTCDRGAGPMWLKRYCI